MKKTKKLIKKSLKTINQCIAKSKVEYHQKKHLHQLKLMMILTRMSMNTLKIRLQVQGHIQKFLKLGNSINQQDLQCLALESELKDSRIQLTKQEKKLDQDLIIRNLIIRKKLEETKRKCLQKMQIASLNLLTKRKLINQAQEITNLEILCKTN